MVTTPNIKMITDGGETSSMDCPLGSAKGYGKAALTFLVHTSHWLVEAALNDS